MRFIEAKDVRVSDEIMIGAERFLVTEVAIGDKQIAYRGAISTDKGNIEILRMIDFDSQVLRLGSQ